MADLREHPEYVKARAEVEIPGEFGEIASTYGGRVDVQKPGKVSVFVQDDEAIEVMTPDAARELAWALLVMADIAEQPDREDGR